MNWNVAPSDPKGHIAGSRNPPSPCGGSAGSRTPICGLQDHGSPIELRPHEPAYAGKVPLGVFHTQVGLGFGTSVWRRSTSSISSSIMAQTSTPDSDPASTRSLISPRRSLVTLPTTHPNHLMAEHPRRSRASRPGSRSPTSPRLRPSAFASRAGHTSPYLPPC